MLASLTMKLELLSALTAESNRTPNNIPVAGKLADGKLATDSQVGETGVVVGKGVKGRDVVGLLDGVAVGDTTEGICVGVRLGRYKIGWRVNKLGRNTGIPVGVPVADSEADRTNAVISKA